MLQDFINIITSLGVTLTDFTCIVIIFYYCSKPIKWLINKFFKGVD